MWVFWLAGGIYSLPAKQCWQWSPRPQEFTGTFTYGPILHIHLASWYIWDSMCFHTDNWHLAWMSRNTEGKRCQEEIKGGAWRMASLPTKREMLRLHQMIGCPTLKILCAFGVLLLKIKPECCFLKINEKDLSCRADLFWESKPLGRGCGRKASCFISVRYQLCVLGQVAEPLCALVFSSIKWEQTHLRLYASSNYDNGWDSVAYVVSYNTILLALLSCFLSVTLPSILNSLLLTAVGSFCLPEGLPRNDSHSIFRSPSKPRFTI